MPVRPANLPDFDKPPIAEVILGVQFNSLDKLLSPYIGLIWELFRGEFEIVEEQPPLMPVFETFGANPPSIVGWPLQVLPLPPAPRVFLFNSSRTKLLQLQRDRLLHNWRKVRESDAYPRFETMLAAFEDYFKRIANFTATHRLGEIELNQCELTYINHITLRDGERFFEATARLFNGILGPAVLDFLGEPDDARLTLRYIIRSQQNGPMARLLVQAEPARKLDGTNIVQLSLTVRGAPDPPDMSGMHAFFLSGREHIVKGFTRLTSPVMHEEWGRSR